MFGFHIDRQSRVILVAYAVFCVGLVITSLFIVRQVRLVLASTEALYVHPFTVSNKAQEARLAASAIRSEVLFAVLSRDTGQARQAKDHMATLDARFEEALRQVRTFYLGDLTEVDRVEQSYAAWRPKRDNLLAMALRGQFDQAQNLVVTSGTPRYLELDAELDNIIIFARNRAALFLQEARSQRDHAERLIYLVLVGGFAASFLCSAVVIRRVRQLVRAHEQALEHMALHDILTGLPNRQLFSDRLDQALWLAQRKKRQLALLYVDLDRFKEVNDTYGHEAGDQLLVQVSAGFVKAVRHSDTVSRLGGDEFVILLQDVRDHVAMRDVAEKIMQVATTPCYFQGHRLEVSASVGVAVYPSDCGDAETLLGCADEAMYHAKKTGRNRFRFYAEGEAA